MNKSKQMQIMQLNNENDILDVVQKASKILGNPIALFDTSYNLLGYTRGVVTDDEIWNELVTTGTFSQKTVDLFKDENFIADFAESDVITPMSSPKLKYKRVNGKLFDKDGVQIANICVVACQKNFDCNDTKMIELLCDVLSVKLQHSPLHSKIDRVFGQSILSRLIGGEQIKFKEIAAAYENLKPCLFVAVADISGYDKTNTHLAYFRDIFKKLQPDYKYFIHLNHIVIILSTRNKYLSRKKDLAKLNEFFKEHNIFGGISSKFTDLMQLRMHHAQAINALNFGLKNKNKKNIFFYDNYRVEHVLNAAGSAINIGEVFHPLVFEIREYDKAHKTNLINILYSYYAGGLNADATKNDLCMSDKEFKKAMYELENTFEIDFKNADMSLSIYLSIKILNRFK